LLWISTSAVILAVNHLFAPSVSQHLSGTDDPNKRDKI
jgi:hypothetical protein